MTRLARNLSALVITALLAGTAMAASPQGNATAAQPSDSLQHLALFIRGGCPYNLDKVCHRAHNGKMICHCQS